MRPITPTRWGAALVGLLVLPLAAAAADAAKPAAHKLTDKQLIASALSAAPRGLRAHAGVMVADDKGEMRTLRESKNGFTCMPDAPTTPGPDPMCMDKASMDFIHAMLTKSAPPAGKVGLMYMLAGGTDASNTDPYAEKPMAANHWIKTGPHLMIAGADAAFYDAYPKDKDPDTSRPYVMWAGTPYQHLMVPVK
ncbi:MAG: hypothetical protein JSR15_06245 [Proteobacteria bacterium]|nr:hypothetical protein [Pseudomonadota bacterium]